MDALSEAETSDLYTGFGQRTRLTRHHPPAERQPRCDSPDSVSKRLGDPLVVVHRSRHVRHLLDRSRPGWRGPRVRRTGRDPRGPRRWQPARGRQPGPPAHWSTHRPPGRHHLHRHELRRARRRIRLGAAHGPDPVPQAPEHRRRPDRRRRLPARKRQTHWEVELGVVIGCTSLYLDSPEDAAAHIAGYVTANDLSEREFQLEISGGQWSKGKSLPGFAPLGPWLATPDEVDHRAVTLRSFVNGEPRQDSSYGRHDLQRRTC